MDDKIYLTKVVEVLAAFEQDEENIERLERTGLYTVKEITEMLEKLKQSRDWLLESLAKRYI